MSVMKVVWKTGTCIKADAADVYNELEALRAQTGALKPEDIVDMARASTSAAHGAFTWDDTKAAHKCRLDEARHLVRSITVVRSEAKEQGPQKAYVNVVTAKKPDAPAKHVYTSVEDALSDAAMRQQILDRAHSEMEAFKRKYQVLTELANVIQAIDTTLASLKKASG